MELAHRYDFVYFAPGIHPEELDGISDGENGIPVEFIDRIRELAMDKKCVAIGEIGLDYYWDSSRKETQKSLFRKQLELALDLRKPVIIHDRDAHGDCLEIIKEYFPPVGVHTKDTDFNFTTDAGTSPGVFHCYSGSVEMAEELLKRGFYLGFDGPVTYKNARKTLEVLEMVPEDKILIETDSPYLSPVPMRGKRNDSGNLEYIVEKIAEIRGKTPEYIAKITSENAKRLFNF